MKSTTLCLVVSVLSQHTQNNLFTSIKSSVLTSLKRKVSRNFCFISPCSNELKTSLWVSCFCLHRNIIQTFFLTSIKSSVLTSIQRRVSQEISVLFHFVLMNSTTLCLVVSVFIATYTNHLFHIH